MKRFNDKDIIKGWRLILNGLGLDLNDANFKETPDRILRSYYEIFEGIDNDEKIEKILSTSFPTKYDGMIIENPIRCYSMCPHHFLPVIYDVSIGYIPIKGGLGLSKLPRLVQHLAKAPKLQEDFTKEIVDVFNKKIKPKGVIVIVQGEHLCMHMRGIRKPECSTITSSFHGCFKDGKVRSEFLSLVKKAE